MVSNSCHFRSTSMPSRSHPLVLKVEEELKSVRGWQSSSSSSSMAEILSSGLDHLNILYSSVEELLRLPLTQQALSCVDTKWVNDMVDDSLVLLDVCSTIRNDLPHLKEKLHDLQSAFRIRRTGDDQGIMSARIEAYLRARKKLKKEMSKCLGVLKTIETSRSILLPAGMPASPDHNQDGLPVFNVLRELRDVNITIFRNLALFVSGDTKPKSGVGRWSLVSRVLGTKRVACEGEEKINKVGRVDISLHALLHTHRTNKDAEVIHVYQNTQRQLETMEFCIKDLEVAVECIFRHLVQTRVSLLNILTR